MARAGPGTDKLPARRREELALGKGWTRNRQTTSQTEGRVSSWKLPARRREELALGKGWTRNRQPDGGKS